MANPIASGPKFRFTPNGGGHDLRAEWGSAVATSKGEFYLDLSSPGTLDPSFDHPVAGLTHRVDILGLAADQAYHIRVASLNGGVVVEENAPDTTPVLSLPILQAPPDVSTLTVTLTGAKVTPPGPPYWPRLGWPWWPWPYKPCKFLSAIGCVATGATATLKVRVMNGASAAPGIPVDFSVKWGTGAWTGQVLPDPNFQVLSDASGYATVQYVPQGRGQVIVVGASTPYCPPSLTQPTMLYIMVC